MKHTTFLFLLLASLCVSAQRKVKVIRDYSITEGQTRTIIGEARSEADIYFEERGDGTFTAHRLTVRPKTAFEKVTAPYLNNATPYSIQVNWKAYEADDNAVVLYGTNANDLTQRATASAVSIGGWTTYPALRGHYVWHSALLTGLQPDTYYYYKVVTGGGEENVYRFRTMPEADSHEKFRLLVLGDHQRNERSDYEWLLKAAKRTLDRKYGEHEWEEHVRMLLNIGDQVDSGKVDQYEKVHLYKSRQVMTGVPIMTVVGNHELFRDPNLDVYRAHYDSYGNLTYQGIRSGTALYYAYQAGRTLFIVMNSDGADDAQRDWVRRVVEAADKDADVDFIISTQHRPLYAEQWSLDVSAWMKNTIMPILSASPKHVLNLSGHHHLYARGQMTDTPVYHVITGGGVGTSADDYDQLWTPSTPEKHNHPEVQKTIDQWTYQIVELDSETKTMHVETYSLGNSRLCLDNVLIDSFSRCLTDHSTPSTPSIQTVAAPISDYPFTLLQEGEADALHSAHYQFATDADFAHVVLDRVVTFEDYFDVNSDFTPKDQMEGRKVTECSINTGELRNGTYFVRVRNRNMNLNWSAFSAPQTITVAGQTEARPDRQFYAPGETIRINFSGAPVGTKAWVGIYRKGNTPGHGDSHRWGYTNTASGTQTYTISEEDEYFAVLLNNDGYEEISPRIPFLVCRNCSEGTPLLMTTDKQEYGEGDPILLSLSNAPALSNDWMGIYPADVTDVSATQSLVYEYVKGSTSTIRLNVPTNGNFQGYLQPGEYFATYLLRDGYTEMFPRVYFSVDDASAVRQPTDEDAPRSTFHTLDGIRIPESAMRSGGLYLVRTGSKVRVIRR